MPGLLFCFILHAIEWYTRGTCLKTCSDLISEHLRSTDQFFCVRIKKYRFQDVHFDPHNASPRLMSSQDLRLKPPRQSAKSSWRPAPSEYINQQLTGIRLRNSHKTNTKSNSAFSPRRLKERARNANECEISGAEVQPHQVSASPLALTINLIYRESSPTRALLCG